MFRNYFNTALRNMRRNKLFTGLNVFGLATGLACSILIFLWVQDELSYDKFNPGAEKIFRLTGRITNIEAAVVPAPLAEAIKREIPAIARTTRIKTDEKVVTIGARKFNEKDLCYADTNFLRMFNYPLLLGNNANVLMVPNAAVLTEATAIKYFGSAAAAMGKSIFVDNDIKGSGFQVTGVLKNIPANSHLQFGLLLPIQNYDRIMNKSEAWNNFDYYVYFQLADAVNADGATVKAVEKQINTLRNKAIAGSDGVPAVISAQCLTDIHLHSNFMLDVDGNGNIEYVRIFMLVAIFIIFIACINFMNLATALSGTRAKEVGLRKTIGALRWQLAGQFIGESMLLSFLSLIVALALVYMALPFFNTLASKSISLNLYDLRLAGKILGITVLAGLLAGVYPAVYISSFNVTKVLKGGVILKGKGSFLRNGLVVLQFCISVILMISTIVVYNQLNFIHNRDIGFNKENLLYINLPEVGDLKDNADALKAALAASRGIDNFTITQDLPTNLTTGTQITWRGMEEGTQLIAYRLGVDDEFLKTFGMKMVAGHFFSRDFKGGDSAFVVNETAVMAMKMDPSNAVGRMITINGREGAIMGSTPVAPLPIPPGATIMDSSARDFLIKLLETPSPSGYERPIQDVVRRVCRDFADRVTTDLHGNVIAVKNPGAKAAGDVRRALRPDRHAGHAHRRRRLPLRADHRRLGPAAAHRPADDDLDGAAARCPAVISPQADSPADRRRAEAGREAEGPVARHRREEQGRGEASWCESATR